MTFKFTYQPSKDLNEANKQITNLVELLKNEFLQMASLETTKEIEEKVDEESENTGRKVAQVVRKTSKNASHIALLATFNDVTGQVSVTAGLVDGIERSSIQLKGDQIHLDGDTYIGSGFTLYGDNIASRTIKASHIKGGTITANEIAGKTITADEIASGTITANEIAAHTITAAEISTSYVYAGSISANQITSGYISASRISAEDLDLTGYSITLGTGGYYGTITYRTGYGFSNGVVFISPNLYSYNVSAAKMWLNSPSTISSSPNLVRDTDNEICVSSASSKRWKHDIKPIENKDIAPERLYDIPVVQFVYNANYLKEKDQRYGKDIPGFIAEDIKELYPIACDIDAEGEAADWNARYIIPPMLKLIQDQNERLTAQEEQIQEQQETIRTYEDKVNNLEERIQRLEKLMEVSNG